MTKEQQEKVNNFLNNRTPFYIDSQNIDLRVITGNDSNLEFTKIFYKLHYPWLTTIRGYVMPDEYLMIYQDDYEIPNCAVALIQYLFAYFPKVKWIGLGCIKGEPGEIWKPRFVIEKDSKYIPHE